MKPSSFQERIEHQFDFICMRAMDDERKNYFLYLSRLASVKCPFRILANISSTNLRRQTAIHLIFKFLRSLMFRLVSKMIY